MNWLLFSSLIIFLISLYYWFMKDFDIKCTCCKERNMDCFSEIENGEVNDYHKCDNCGYIELVNSEPYPYNVK